jgi:hypothetical protein
VNIGLIGHIVRYSLDKGYHAVLDGILCAGRYEQILTGMIISACRASAT